MNRCALFIEADPFSKKELQVINQLKNIYDCVDVFIERKSQNKFQLFNYDEKVDIIKHDLSSCDQVFIHPVDTTKIDVLKKFDIHDIAIIASYGSDFRKLHTQMSMFYQMLENCQVIFIPVKQKYDVDSKYIWQLIINDETKTTCRKFISDYVYVKTKMKLVRKLVVNYPERFKEAIRKVFADRSEQFEFFDVSLFNDDIRLIQKLGQLILKASNKCLVLYSSFKNQYLEQLSNVIISSDKDTQKQSYVLDDKSDVTITRSLINLLNGKLKKFGNLNFF